MNTHIHICKHTRIYKHTCTHPPMNMSVHIHEHTCIHLQTPLYTSTNKLVHNSEHTCTHQWTCRYTPINTLVHIFEHTDTHYKHIFRSQPTFTTPAAWKLFNFRQLVATCFRPRSVIFSHQDTSRCSRLEQPSLQSDNNCFWWSSLFWH